MLLYFMIGLCACFGTSVVGEVLWQCEYFDPADPWDGCDWNLVSYINHDDMYVFVPDPDEPEGDDYVLRVFYPKYSYAGNATNKGGIEFFAQPVEPREELELSYDIYFSDEFPWALGGKQPGLYGGYMGENPAPGEQICAGGNRRPDCFSTRYMWREEGAGEVYAYFPEDDGTGRRLGTGSWFFESGTWQNIRQRIRLSTPGEDDGLVQIFFNDELVFEDAEQPIRIEEQVRIDTLFFSTFFGGSSIPEFAAPDDCYVYYRNLAISD